MPQIAHIVEGCRRRDEGACFGGKRYAGLAGKDLRRSPGRRGQQIALDQAAYERAIAQRDRFIPVARFGTSIGIGAQLRGRATISAAEQVNMSSRARK